jgi:hypothetical protein
VWVARTNKVSPARAAVMIAVTCVAVLLSGCSGGPSESEVAHVKQVAAEAQARKDTVKRLKDQAATAEAVAAQAAAAKKAAAARAVAARVAAARKAAAVKAAAARVAATKKAAADAARAEAVRVAAAKKAAAVKATVPRDANGFALGGPPQATSPANYDHPSHSDCLQFRDELRAWSTYQNQHRPAGSNNDLPSSGEVQYLYVVCHLEY